MRWLVFATCRRQTPVVESATCLGLRTDTQSVHGCKDALGVRAGASITGCGRLCAREEPFVATAINYQEELDFSKPLTEQWGGRFLTESEVGVLLGAASLNDYEYVAMNLEHLWDIVGGTNDHTIAMKHADLVRLLSVANDLKYVAEKAEELAQKIDTHAWAVWTEQNEAQVHA